LRLSVPFSLNVLLFLLLLFLLATFPPDRAMAAAEEEPSYSFGVFPFLPASRLVGTFAPIAAEVGQALHRRIHYQSASTFEKFMTRLEAEEFDIAFVQPFDYVRLGGPVGYIPVARRRESLSAVFVVREESAALTLVDLKGKTIAMAPEVAALSYLGKAALLEAGFQPGADVTIKYMQDHHSCLQQVVIGTAEACVTGRPALRLFENAMNLKLRILHETPAIPQMLFIVHPRVPATDREIIRTTLLATTLAGVDPGLRTLLMKNDETPFIPTTDADFGEVRRYWQVLESMSNGE
jgi:phosphonate transport system substrate-binding protein